ncbi:BnaC04g12210D [Brassica napus]|uniref:BnaC04g12210D protein n=1 Tax=Brassica napus TaxID=3708 RepID=A0A078FG29_BRANA|nr:BnaC04g12210D [Brassica napus]
MKDLIAAAIKSTYDTRSPGGVDRCIDLLIRLKSLSLSVKDILYFSKSIFKLETLRRHRNPKIREVSQSLFTSLLKTLYSQGTDNPAGLNKARLKRKEANTGLERLAKHKDRTICSAATTLLQIWRQRIREQERKESSAIKNPRRVQRTCGSEKKNVKSLLPPRTLVKLKGHAAKRLHKRIYKGDEVSDVKIVA